MENYLDLRLQSEAVEIGNSIGVDSDEIVIIQEIEWLELHHTSEDDEPVYILLIDLHKNEIRRSLNFTKFDFPLESIHLSLNTYSFATVNLNSVNYRFTTIPYIENDTLFGWIIVGMSLDSIESWMSAIKTVYIIIFPIVIIIAIMGNTFLTRKALMPMNEMSKSLQRIQSSNLSEKLGVPQTNDEVEDLANSINELLSRLEISFHSIQNFTVDASHELKTPLTVIQSELEVIEKEIIESQSGNLESIHYELTRMTKIIDDLTTLAKLDGQKLSLVIEKVWINDLLYEEIERYKKIISKRNISINIEPPPSIAIEGDPHWLGIVISNILDNAIKFSPKNSTVTVQLNEQVNHIQFSIIDQGSGIPENQIERVTKRFYRWKPTSAKQGSGLGLAIVDEIVSAHKGEITFSNLPEGGLKVSVELPINV